MEILLCSATHVDRPTLDNLMQLHQYDLSEVDGRDVDEQGRFAYPPLDGYWIDPGCAAFLITVDGRVAGFALVNLCSRLHSPFNGHGVAEFFVLRKYRRQGVGRAAAIQLFNTFPGRWEIASFATNVPAHAFWRSVINEYTGGHYDEQWQQKSDWRGHIQSFATQAVASDFAGSTGM